MEINKTSDSVDKTASAASYQITEVLGEKGAQLRNAEQQLLNNYRYIYGNPIASLGMALVAAGFLLNRLLSDR
ncbi:DUF883 domain-containing protein [Methylobacter sp.]|uniref:DUF883 domain-containing protein n=1 Tax=Methylobacter sp. TaxID=2051955 RepID=UPI0012203970|nr:DUF883 domain-containing protein [Methylobacter sp.]TAK60611.1 MAG: DUF883 domain-containing protein [Methylobacter sp.]